MPARSGKRKTASWRHHRPLHPPDRRNLRFERRPIVIVAMADQNRLQLRVASNMGLVAPIVVVERTGQGLAPAKQSRQRGIAGRAPPPRQSKKKRSMVSLARRNSGENRRNDDRDRVLRPARYRAAAPKPPPAPARTGWPVVQHFRQLRPVGDNARRCRAAPDPSGLPPAGGRRRTGRRDRNKPRRRSRPTSARTARPYRSSRRDVDIVAGARHGRTPRKVGSGQRRGPLRHRREQPQRIVRCLRRTAAQAVGHECRHLRRILG